MTRTAEGQQAGLTNSKITKLRDYENSDLPDREKMALRYADYVKYNPQGVTDEFMKDLQTYLTDAEICEIGYILLAYGGAHNFLSSIGEDVVDENGVSLVQEDGFGKDGFPLVFNTHQGITVYQDREHWAMDATLPETPFMTDIEPPEAPPERSSSQTGVSVRSV